MNSYFEQGGFYGGGSGGEQAYRFPLGLSVSPYGQPAPRQDGYDPTASCKLYAPHQEHMTPNPFKVDCVKEQNGYGGSKDMSGGGWGPAVRPGCTPDPVTGRGYPPDPSTSPRERSSHAPAWNTCGMTAAAVQQQHHQQQQQQTGNQMSQPSNTTFYPWMAIAGKLHIYKSILFLLATEPLYSANFSKPLAQCHGH